MRRMSPASSGTTSKAVPWASRVVERDREGLELRPPLYLASNAKVVMLYNCGFTTLANTHVCVFRTRRHTYTYTYVRTRAHVARAHVLDPWPSGKHSGLYRNTSPTELWRDSSALSLCSNRSRAHPSRRRFMFDTGVGGRSLLPNKLGSCKRGVDPCAAAPSL